SDGLHFPPCGVDDLPQILRGREAGGQLEHDGMVEVVSCLERDGRPVFRDLRWGVYAVVKAPQDYARTCFKEYGLKNDVSCRSAGPTPRSLTAPRCGHAATWSGPARRSPPPSRRNEGGADGVQAIRANRPEGFRSRLRVLGDRRHLWSN